MKIKRNKKSYKWFLCGLILVVVLTISYRVSKANYRISNSIELTTGKVVSSPYDFKLISLYIDGVEQEKGTIMPESGYVINEEQSYCYKDSKNNKDNNAKLYTDNLGNHIFKGISKGNKCILYFEKATINKPATMEELLKNYYIHKKVRFSENKDFNVPYTSETKQTVFIAPDGDNFSYYFAGNPLDNWVEFGGYYWRIIRINGDGSIRMIYQGTEPNTIGTGTQINGSTYAFNTSYNDNAYVGYWYQTGVLRGLQEPSNVYTELNNWFASSNIKQGTSYFNLIDPNAGFCGDRSSYTDISGKTLGGGAGITITYYGAFVRLGNEGAGSVTASTATIEPTYNCADSNDLYTYSGANHGNHKLANPVGLITADELSYAGLVFNMSKSVSASGNFLNTDSSYWAMSPSHFGVSNAFVFVVHPNGLLSYGYVHDAYGIRPTINLKKGVTFTGNGTISNPYKVI